MPRRTDQRRAAIFVLYQHQLTGREIDLLLKESEAGTEPKVTDFTRELVEGTLARKDELDGIIANHAIDWAIDRIAPLERCILRIALYEVLYRDDIPTEVAIDEAVEIAKKYCSLDAPGFVNGILGAVVKEGATS